MEKLIFGCMRDEFHFSVINIEEITIPDPNSTPSFNLFHQSPKKP